MKAKFKSPEILAGPSNKIQISEGKAKKWRQKNIYFFIFLPPSFCLPFLHLAVIERVALRSQIAASSSHGSKNGAGNLFFSIFLPVFFAFEIHQFRNDTN